MRQAPRPIAAQQAHQHAARLDEAFSPGELVHVTDADSSQAIAIQEAMAGKNLVIQGPPGTGKSQTITNIIAGAVQR
jgi:predicted ATPase with chaperone activity